MIDVPVLNPRFVIEKVEDEGIFFLSEGESNFLPGSLFVDISTLIDGNKKLDEIVDILFEKEGFKVSLAEIYFAFEILTKKGYIIDKSKSPSKKIFDEWLFWNKLGVDVANNKLKKNLSILNLSHAPHQELKTLISSLSLNLDFSSNRELQIVLVDDFLNPELREVNKKNFNLGKSWILVKPVGGVLWFGGVFSPNKSACWECLEQRISSNREVETYLNQFREKGDHIVASKGYSLASLQIAWSILGIEIMKWFNIDEDKNTLKDQILTYDLSTHSINKHTIVKRPQCKTCGSYDYIHPSPKPIKLTERLKKFTTDGGHRVSTPKETLKKYQHHISPITGVVSMLDNITPDNEVINSYIAGHNSAVQYNNLFTLKKGLRSKSAGKGITDEQAKVSGMCEAIERYSGLFRSNAIRVRGSYESMKEECINPNDYLLFSDYQYRTREEWNKSAGHFQIVPKKFDYNTEIEWTPVYSMTNDNFKYFPTAYCYYSYNSDKINFFCWADSNGNAAGNSIEEAILQGFLELVERDAISLWWYNRLNRPEVDLDSFDIPFCRKMKEYYKNEINRDIWVIDLTTDFNIPVFAAISRRNDKPVEDILFGFGAHFDPKVALLRALTELNQFMPAVMNVNSPKDSYLFDDQDSLKWWKTATIDNQPYLLPDKTIKKRKMMDYDVIVNEDIKEDVLLCKSIVESLGMEMFVLDQTQPDIDLPVVKVIVPGMRHFWKRLASGRLYDVPVKMGWLKKPYKENEMNPIPMFI